MNYDEMPAGPEMDFLVATEVLGQEPPEVSEEFVRGVRWGWRRLGEYCWEKRMIDPDEGWYAEAHWPQPYSVNMSLLTELLKKLVEDEYAADIGIPSDGSVQCNISTGGKSGKFLVYGLAETVDEIPLAVCRACLKLMEGKGRG